MIDRHKNVISLFLLALIFMEAGFSVAYTLCTFQLISQTTTSECSCGCTADCCTVGKTCCCDTSAPLPFHMQGLKQYKPCSPNEPPSLAPVSPFFSMFYIAPSAERYEYSVQDDFVDLYHLKQLHLYLEPPTPPPDCLFS